MTVAEKLNLFCLSRSDEVSQVLTELTSKVSGLRIDNSHNGSVILDSSVVEKVKNAEVILLEIDPNDPEELGQLKRIVDAADGRSSIIATARNIEARAVRDLIRNDVNDFLPFPFSIDELTGAVKAAQNRQFADQTVSAQGKVIVVARAKGGMGATTAAIHIAQSLAKKKKRKIPAKRVCFLDLDLQFGDAANYLDLQPRRAMIEIANEPERLDTALFESFLQDHDKGISVLTTPSDAMPLDALHPRTVERMITLAREAFDYVIVDLPLAFPAWLEPVFSQLNTLIMVSQMNVPAILQTRRFLEIIKEEGLYNLPVKIVLNRYSWSLRDMSLKKRCVSALDQDVFFWLPSDYRLASTAANEGRSMFNIRNRSPLARNIRKMSTLLERDLLRASLATVPQRTA